MRIANGQTQLRLLFTEKEHKMLSDNGRLNVLYVSLDPREQERFVVLSEQEIPGSFRVAFSRSSSGKSYTDLMTLTRVKFKNIPDIFWAPEEVVLTRDNSYSQVGGWTVNRPPMERKAGSGTGRLKGKAKKSATKKPQPQPVPVSAPLIENALSLRQAVKVINEAKRAHGDDLVIEINKETGGILLMIQLGN